jgi:alpha-tubulin suppressor-like RCC1 family protein
VGHVLALTEEGTVYSWGCNEDGQLGFTPSSHNRRTGLRLRIQQRRRARNRGQREPN